jgi:hypothetical protein
MPTLTIDQLRAYWIALTKKEEYFYLLIFVAVVVVIANGKLLCRIAAIPVKLAFSVAGLLLGIAIVWGGYQLFFG